MGIRFQAFALKTSLCKKAQRHTSGWWMERNRVYTEKPLKM
jgi:hypothetical protein